MKKATITLDFSGLGLIFIVLKLVGVINWSWWWVTSPLWLPLAIVSSLFLIVGVLHAIFN